ncbi:alpha/beta fold hydrolase [uncultured Dietzia sp.]|uniref:alpha/beta fold hydrolase n=1 Tax=uncultured Dietzia sp. TaxID=395519 RepID=UPI0030FB608F
MGLYHQITGAGPTIVLLHGVCHRAHAWDPVVPLLADRFRVVVVDLPGHGRSADLPDTGDVLDYFVSELVTLLEEVVPAGERPHIAGNSLGGFLALELGARGLASSVTALSPAGFFRSHADWRYTVSVFRSLRRAAGRIGRHTPALTERAAGRAVMMAVFCARPWRYPAEAAAIDSEAIVSNTVLDRADRRAFVFSAPVDENLPITIRWGRFDMVLPVRQVSLATRLFPQARVEVSADGHVPMSDDPEGVAASIAACAERGLAYARAGSRA